MKTFKNKIRIKARSKIFTVATVLAGGDIRWLIQGQLVGEGVGAQASPGNV